MTNPSPDLIHLVRMLAGMYVEFDRARYEAAALPTDEIAEFLISKVPVLQGTGNQIDLQRVSEQAYDPKAAGRAIKAMLAESATSPIPTQVEVESVDTPTFIKLLGAYSDTCGNHHLEDEWMSARHELIAHIDSIITARVAAARQEAIEEAAEACENLVESIGDRSAYDDREMYDTELERMHTAMDCAKAIRALAASQAAPAKAEGCECTRCLNESGQTVDFLGRQVPIAGTRMVLCATCGNKRCPHANDHRNACTNSNEPGQPGSSYPAAPSTLPEKNT